jgi:hypothetical protein
MRKLHRLIGFVAVVSLGWSSTASAQNPVTFWNNIASQAVSTGRSGPPGLLDLALVQAAVHDAVQAIEGRFEPYAFSDPSAGGSTTAAVAAAAYGVLARLYPTQRPGATGLDAKYSDYVVANGLAGNSGLNVGANAAAVLFTYYRPLIALPPNTGGTGIGEWRPTPPSFTSGLYHAVYVAPVFAVSTPAAATLDERPVSA